MSIAALVVSVLALVISGGAVVYTRRQAMETGRQADAAHEQLRIAATPQLTVVLLDDSSSTGPNLLYEIRNDGPQDLDSVLIERPETADSVRYPLARLGGDDFEDEIEVGPLRLGRAGRFLLSVGSTPRPPEFRVRIVCRAGADTWTLSRPLEPRPKPNRVWTS